MITANSAPPKDDVKAAVKASPALPCRAMGWPSKVVATDHGSPGILNSTEGMAPPHRAPPEMQHSMSIHEVGDIENVNGSRIATPLAPPRPGSTPIMTPSMIPTSITRRLNG